MTTDFIAWSHSRRSAYISCPKSFYHQNVAKKGTTDRVEFTQSKAMLAGLAVDDALTARVSKGPPLPPQYEPYEGMIQVLMSAPGQRFTQMRVALNQAFEPCGYLDWDTTWVRAIYDIAIVDKARMF